MLVAILDPWGNMKKASAIPINSGCGCSFFALYVLSMGGHGYGGVGTTTYDVTRQILLNHTLAIQKVPWGKFGAVSAVTAVWHRAFAV